MRTYIFFEEGKEDTPEFEIQANDFKDAFDEAYEWYGPQVNDLYYKVKNIKNKWLPNFAHITDGEVTIKHWSTSSTIQIIVDDPNNSQPVSLFLDYGQFDSLIECIKSLEIDE